ncbi:MAG: sugar ABC transporter ATP-binding protein [Woeseia sp.]|nr:sugar ABC transporter ATP-binding protein [Woeseia sp.]
MSSINIENVTKKFGDFTALSELDLEIKNGEFVALLGPSGCGKTTTMNMIAGLEEPTHGNILFDGKDLSTVKIQKRNIGFVFQNYAIFTHLTVFKNLSYGLEVQKFSKSEVERKVKSMAKRLGIDHRLDEKAAKLSVNEMQKVAIARSAIVEPRIFLLDEPLSNLDASFRAYMRAELKILQKEFGQTMVYVTHDQIEAMSLADKIAIIDQGKLMQFGDPLGIYNDPDNRFVANFVGSPKMNLLDGELSRENGKLNIKLDDGKSISMSGKVAHDFETDSSTKNASFGVRPHDIYFGDKKSNDDIQLTGIVDLMEKVGPKRMAHIKFGNSTFVGVDEQDKLNVNDEVKFCLPSDNCFAFNFDNGLRLGTR